MLRIKTSGLLCRQLGGMTSETKSVGPSIEQLRPCTSIQARMLACWHNGCPVQALHWAAAAQAHNSTLGPPCAAC